MGRVSHPWTSRPLFLTRVGGIDAVGSGPDLESTYRTMTRSSWVGPGRHPAAIENRLELSAVVMNAIDEVTDGTHHV